MSKKDFELIAKVLREYRRDYPNVDYHADALAGRFASALWETNPRFNRDRFIDAVTRSDR